MERVIRAVRDAVESTAFSGVVRIDQGDRSVLELARGQAHRALDVLMDVATCCSVASVTKGVTALTIASLVVDGSLDWSTPVRRVLGNDLPLIDDAVTIEHLLAHVSGIGDYLDESALDDITAYAMPVPVHRMATSDDYLTVLGGHPQREQPGERFRYCNSGFVVLALIAERVAGVPFVELAGSRVLQPAGMAATGFFRSDQLPARAALGYLWNDRPRTNVLHLPVVGSGDGGLYSTVVDLHALWRAMFAGRIVPLDVVGELVRPRSDVPDESKRYGLGFWLAATGDAVLLEGYDAGVSCRTCHHPSESLTWTVLSNTSEGAWPVARALATALA